MSQNAKDRHKEALKKLRRERKPLIKAAAAKMKAQKKVIETIKTALQSDSQTVPEISATTGLATAEVLYYIATLKKYGAVNEAKQAGMYFKYALAEGVSAGAAD